jgi:CMP-N-acetylneuraminic acid synthetase
MFQRELLVCAFVPARGGSSGIRKKNILPLGDKPLIKHTLDFAKTSDFFHKIIVSTDCPTIAKISTDGILEEAEFIATPEDYVVQISDEILIHKRKTSQAQNLSLIEDTMFDLSLPGNILSKFEYTVMLQPTSPFRRYEELNSLKEIIKSESHWTSIASFTDVHGMHPQKMWHINDSGMMSEYITDSNSSTKPRQSLPKVFIKDGAYYCLRREVLESRQLLGKKVLPMMREGVCTLNIDSQMDFEIAKLIEENRERFGL